MSSERISVELLPGVKALATRFAFLDQLRESGATNMYGASPWLMGAFNIKRDSATAILSAWMRTFSDKLPSERAAEALHERVDASPADTIIAGTL